MTCQARRSCRSYWLGLIGACTSSLILAPSGAADAPPQTSDPRQARLLVATTLSPGYGPQSDLAYPAPTARPVGVAGPNTRAAVYDRVGHSPCADSDLASELVATRGEVLCRLVSRRTSSLKFLTGWMLRLLSLMKEVRF